MKVALVLGAVVALAVVPGGAAQAVFVDLSGDQIPFEDLVAPDITTVEVVNTDGGVIGFRVAIANYPALPPRSRIAVLFDLDRNFATGFSGFEYAFSHEIGSNGDVRLLFERWNLPKLEFDVLPTTDLISTFEEGLYTLLIPRGRLENTRAFDFGLYAALFHPTREGRAARDDAPNANIWTYELSGLPPPRLTASALVLTPRRPVAGRQLTVSAVVRHLDTGAAVDTATVSCRARLGRTPLRARGVFRARNAHCIIGIPRDARGKRLAGAITVRSAGATVTKRFSFRVR